MEVPLDYIADLMSRIHVKKKEVKIPILSKGFNESSHGIRGWTKSLQQSM